MHARAGSGKIGYDELFEFVRGRRHSLDHRNKLIHEMTFKCPPGLTMDSIDWSVETLRLMVQQMLLRCRVGAADLMRAWDRSGDYELNQHEFQARMRELFRHEHEDLWQNELRAFVDEAFVAVSQIGGTDSMSSISVRRVRKTIDIVQLEQWLNAPEANNRIRRKNRRMLTRQKTRRLEMEKPITKEKPRVDLRARVKEGIHAASQRAVYRQMVSCEEEADHVLRWEESHGWQPQRWESPPLQRWETPKSCELPPLTFARPRFESEEERFGMARLPPPPGGWLAPPPDHSPRSPLPTRAASLSRSPRSPLGSQPSSPTMALKTSQSLPSLGPRRASPGLSPTGWRAGRFETRRGSLEAVAAAAAASGTPEAAAAASGSGTHTLFLLGQHERGGANQLRPRTPLWATLSVREMVLVG